MNKGKPNDDDARAKELRRILERIDTDAETVGTSSMARVSKQFKTMLDVKDGSDADHDPIEVLGKRIGRSLGWIAVVILVFYLITTYLL